MHDADVDDTDVYDANNDNKCNVTAEANIESWSYIPG